MSFLLTCLFMHIWNVHKKKPETFVENSRARPISTVEMSDNASYNVLYEDIIITPDKRTSLGGKTRGITSLNSLNNDTTRTSVTSQDNLQTLTN